MIYSEYLNLNRRKWNHLMDNETNKQYWNKNAEAWVKLSRAGYDTYRNYLNTPAFLAMLPDISGLSGLDIGCGEGYNTRLLAERAGRISALDLSRVFAGSAATFPGQGAKCIDYLVANAEQIPFAEGSFDFATGFMSFMDIPNSGKVITETYRILKPGGFLQFSISHPCFDTPHHKNLRDENGRTYAFELGDYFRPVDGEVSEWLFSAAPAEARAGLENFKTPRFTRTLGYWLNSLIQAGFVIEQVEEPCPDDETIRQHPNLQDAQVMAYFLIIRARKALKAV